MDEDEQLALFAGVDNQPTNYSPLKQRDDSPSKKPGSDGIDQLLGLNFSNNASNNSSSQGFQGGQGASMDPFGNFNASNVANLQK